MCSKLVYRWISEEECDELEIYLFIAVISAYTYFVICLFIVLLSARTFYVTCCECIKER